MPDSMISLTYAFHCKRVERTPHPGDEMAKKRRFVPEKIERTIIVPKRMCDEMLDLDVKTRSKSYENFEFIGIVHKLDVSMTYPAPHYWST